MATALQVFHNLGSLEVTVSKVLATCHNQLVQSVDNALDMSSLTQQQINGAGKGYKIFSLSDNWWQKNFVGA